MKSTYITFLLLVFIIISCGKKKSYELIVTTDLGDGKSAYLIEIDQNNQPATIDTAIIEKGTIQFNRKIDYPSNSFLQIEDYPQYFLFIAEQGKITMEIKKDDLPHFTLGGTYSNIGLNTYKNDIESFRSSLESIGNEGYEAQSSGDSVLLEDLYDQYYDIEKKIIQYDIDFVKDNPESFLSLLILQSHSLTKTIPNDSLLNLYDQLSSKIKKGSVNKQVSDALGIRTEDLKVGEIAPNFSGPRPDGEVVSLKQLQGKITLLDFWASWCKPCRIQSPELVELYKNYASTGFNIVSISLDQERNKWLQAIEDDGLGSWDHISNLEWYEGPIARAYNISAIPYLIVLDSIGSIIEIGHDLDAIRSEIELQLGNKN